MPGDFAPGTTVYPEMFNTRVGGVATALVGGAVSVYKNGSNTQSTAGVTLTADFDGVTGQNHVAIDTSADGAFYSAGGQFNVVVTAGTVGAFSAVGSTVDTFTLGLTSAADDAVLAAIAALNNLSSAGAQAAAAAALAAYTAATAANVTSAQTAILTKLPAALSANGNIKADVEEVNEVNLQGVGTSGNPWRPA